MMAHEIIMAAIGFLSAVMLCLLGEAREEEDDT